MMVGVLTRKGGFLPSDGVTHQKSWCFNDEKWWEMAVFCLETYKFQHRTWGEEGIDAGLINGLFIRNLSKNDSAAFFRWESPWAKLYDFMVLGCNWLKIDETRIYRAHSSDVLQGLLGSFKATPSWNMLKQSTESLRKRWCSGMRNSEIIVQEPLVAKNPCLERSNCGW